VAETTNIQPVTKGTRGRSKSRSDPKIQRKGTKKKMKQALIVDLLKKNAESSEEEQGNQSSNLDEVKEPPRSPKEKKGVKVIGRKSGEQKEGLPARPSNQDQIEVEDAEMEGNTESDVEESQDVMKSAKKRPRETVVGKTGMSGVSPPNKVFCSDEQSDMGQEEEQLQTALNQSRVKRRN
jgi:hypothetical protein